MMDYIKLLNSKILCTKQSYKQSLKYYNKTILENVVMYKLMKKQLGMMHLYMKSA